MLEESLRKAVEDYLKNVDLPEWISEKEKKVIKYLHNKQIINNSQIEKCLEEAIFKRARKDFELLTSKNKNLPYKIYLDYSPEVMPEIFAYALEKGEFSKREIKKIKFDHGENAEDFIKSNGHENLLSELREHILSPPYKIKYIPHVDEGDYIDPHPVDLDGD